MLSFKQENSLDKRIELSQKIIINHPGRYPVIVEPYKYDDITIPKILKRKYLAPEDINMGQLLYQVRKNIENLTPDESLNFFIDNRNVVMNDYLYDVYKKRRDSDGFLYIKYTTEPTFG